MATATDIDTKTNRLSDFNLTVWAKEREWCIGVGGKGIGCLFSDGSNNRDSSERNRIADT